MAVEIARRHFATDKFEQTIRARAFDEVQRIESIEEVYSAPGERGCGNFLQGRRAEPLILHGSLDVTISVDDIFG